MLDPEFGEASAALLIVDWSVKGTGSDGDEVDFEDGGGRRPSRCSRWRYVIDNPFGTA